MLGVVDTMTSTVFLRQNRDFWNSLPTKNNKRLYPERFLQDYNKSP